LAAGFVPTSRTLTINGVTYDLSANRTWTIDTTSATWGNITGVLSNQTDLQTALNSKEPTITAGLISQYWRGDKSWQTLDKTAVGLGNVDNTSDLNKPISTATQTALNLKEDKANKGIPNGYASLAGDGKVPSTQLPSYVDDVIEVANYAALPAIGETGVIYITLDNNNVYRWSGSVYVQISQPNAVWGSITGTLSSQTDLQSALNAKQNNITLTTTGTSGAATLIGATLNIPRYDSSLIGYVPYVGAVSDLNLGVHRILAQRGYFENNGSNDTLNVIHSSGSGYGINVSKGGSGEALIVNKTSGSGNAASILGGVTLIDELHLNTDLSDSYIASASNWNSAFNDKINSASVTGTTTKTLTLNQQDGGTITASWTDDNTDAVSSVFGRTGAVVAVSGDYNTSQVTESTNLYYTEARVNANANVAANTAARHNAVTLGTANGLSLSTQQLSLGLSSASTTGALSSTDWNTFNNKQGAITLTTTGSSGAATFIGNTLNIPDYSSALIGYVPTSRTITINGVTYDLSTNRAWTIDKASVGLGNVDNTSDLNKPISTATQTALNAKQDDITLTTTGTSGAATLVGSTLNIPQYQSVITNPITGTGTTNYVSKFTSPGSIGDSLIFDNGTNVGIGTSSPTAKLSIGGVGSALSFDTLGASGTTEIKTIQDYELSIKNNRGTSTEILVGNEILKFSTSELERMRITSSGNVGIGTTNPYSPLQVGNYTGAGGFSYGTSATFVSAFNSIRATLFVGSTDTTSTQDKGGSIDFGGGSEAGSTPYTFARIKGYKENSGAGYSGYLSFSTTPSGSDANTERMRINSTGNVGIGVTNPGNKLVLANSYYLAWQSSTGVESVGISTLSDNSLSFFNQSERMRITPGGSALFNTTTDPTTGGFTNTTVLIKQRADGLFGGGLHIEENGTTAVAYFGFNGSVFNIGTSYRSTGDYRPITFSTSGLERLRIANNGNVGIGTTNPTQKLEVVGNIKTSQSITIGLGGNYEAGSIYSDGNWGMLFRARSFSPGTANFRWSDAFDNELMQISPSGAVGIGLSLIGTGPQRKLDVVGTHTTSTFRVYYPALNVAGQDASVDIWASEPGVSYYGSGIGANVNGHPYYGRTNTGLGQAFIRFVDGNMMFNTNTSDAVYSERMKITSGGNVGIGTTTPNYKLDVLINEEYQIAWRRDGVSNTWALGSDTNGTYFSNRTTSSLPLYMTNSGNVGIGTTSPSAALHVSKNIGAGEYVAYIQNTGAGNGLKIYNGDWDVSDYLLYTTNGGTAANGYAFVVDGNGKVGIGQTSPTKLLSLKRGGICGIELDDSSAVTDIQSVGGRFIIDTPSQAYIDIASSNQLYVDALSVGVHTAAPDPSAALDVTSTTQGFLPPRMSDTEMNSIAAPAAGLIVWNYDSPALFVFDGGSWRKIDMI
jgi:predicted heme/steroid binding protein